MPEKAFVLLMNQVLELKDRDMYRVLFEKVSGYIWLNECSASSHCR